MAFLNPAKTLFYQHGFKSALGGVTPQIPLAQRASHKLGVPNLYNVVNKYE